MFGYVTIDKPELKFREFDEYRAHYCGLCRELRERYGIPGQLTLTYDLTFVILLLEGLYEPKTLKGKTRCAVHPVVKRPVCKSRITGYAADMNVLLAYYKCMDDWNDEHKIMRRAYAGVLEKGASKVKDAFPEKSRIITEYLERLSNLEKDKSTDIDAVAGCFGHLMEEIFVLKHDIWEPDLRRMSFFLGKYIYLLDAFEDVPQDIKSGSYNIFAEMYLQDDFSEKAGRMLQMMLSESCRSFERLPIVKYSSILRNILYSGVWTRYRAVLRKREKEQEKKYV